MRRVYVKPQTKSILLQLEQAVLGTSTPSAHNCTPTVDNVDNLFSNEKEEWSNEIWEE